MRKGVTVNPAHATGAPRDWLSRNVVVLSVVSLLHGRRQ
jgi:hypothetical protein